MKPRRISPHCSATSPSPAPTRALATALRDGLAAGKQFLEQALTRDASPEVNGWKLTYHVFDYNLDFFELGARDDPAWKLADSPLRYVQRAAAARGGLWGNHGYEAAYAMVYVDGDGDALEGDHSYRLRFATAPPVGAFWSVTMYDVPDFFLVENPIKRYSIGDRTPGLDPRRRRLADDRDPARRARRRRGSRQLAADAGRRVSADPAHVRAARRRVRRQLRAAADHPGVVGAPLRSAGYMRTVCM